MEFIRLTAENIAKEHICCAISDEKDCQVASKKAWLAARFADGLVFLKGNVRGKCFIEYLPAEKAWAPVEAPGCLYIDCLWVSGRFKGEGNADALMDACIADSRAQGKAGICALSSQKKQSFLSDPGYLRHRGFVTADTALPAYELLWLPLREGAQTPCFKPQARTAHTGDAGLALYYTAQCPFTAKYVPLLEEAAETHGLTLRTVRFESAAEAQAAPCPFTAFSLFSDGALLTHEILSVPRFEALLAKQGLI